MMYQAHLAPTVLARFRKLSFQSLDYLDESCRLGNRRRDRSREERKVRVISWPDFLSNASSHLVVDIFCFPLGNGVCNGLSHFRSPSQLSGVSPDGMEPRSGSRRWSVMRPMKHRQGSNHGCRLNWSRSPGFGYCRSSCEGKPPS